MLSISPTHEWLASHPGAVIGLLECSGVEQPEKSPRLDKHKEETEAWLRQRYQGYTRQDFLGLSVIAAYERYYKRFNKTYHVQLQLESIILKGKSLPTVFPLVDAVFIAEIQTCILTAGHDVSRLHPPVCIDVSREGDHITQMNGATRPVRPGDMVMRDAGGISCSIIYGQDNRSPISAHTTHVLYVAYVPQGVELKTVEVHLESIIKNVRLFSPDFRVEQCTLLSA
jgi:DNA/RNA-binding domain of Phe-tRNA-synthetase-like protein